MVSVQDQRREESPRQHPQKVKPQHGTDVQDASTGLQHRAESTTEFKASASFRTQYRNQYGVVLGATMCLLGPADITPIPTRLESAAGRLSLEGSRLTEYASQD